MKKVYEVAIPAWGWTRQSPQVIKSKLNIETAACDAVEQYELQAVEFPVASGKEEVQVFIREKGTEQWNEYLVGGETLANYFITKRE